MWLFNLVGQADCKYFVNVPKQVDKGIPLTRKFPMDNLQNMVDNSFFLSSTDLNRVSTFQTI